MFVINDADLSVKRNQPVILEDRPQKNGVKEITVQPVFLQCRKRASVVRAWRIY